MLHSVSFACARSCVQYVQHSCKPSLTIYTADRVVYREWCEEHKTSNNNHMLQQCSTVHKSISEWKCLGPVKPGEKEKKTVIPLYTADEHRLQEQEQSPK